MSKRTRGTARTQHRRPGTRPAASRAPARQRQALGRPGELEQALSRDEALEVEALTAEAEPTVPSATSEADARTARPPRSARAHHRVKPGSLLAARAATEYVYVVQDLKRITVVAVLLFAALIVLWLLLVVLRVFPLPFY